MDLHCNIPWVYCIVNLTTIHVPQLLWRFKILSAFT